MADQEQKRADDLRRAKRDVRELQATRPRPARRGAPTIDDKWADLLTLDDAGGTAAEIQVYLATRKVVVSQRRVKTAIRTHRERQGKYGRWRKPKTALTPEQAGVWLKRLRGTHEPTNPLQVVLAFQEEPLIDRKELGASNADLVRWLADQDPRVDVTSSQVRRFLHMVVQDPGLRRHQAAILAMREEGKAHDVIAGWLREQDPPVRVLPKRVKNFCEQEEGLQRHQAAILAMREEGKANEAIVRWLGKQDPPVRVLAKQVDNFCEKVMEDKEDKDDGKTTGPTS